MAPTAPSPNVRIGAALAGFALVALLAWRLAPGSSAPAGSRPSPDARPGTGSPDASPDEPRSPEAPMPRAAASEVVIPPERASLLSPILQAHASWPRELSPAPPPASRPAALDYDARTVRRLLELWFDPAVLPPDPEAALGMDGTQLFTRLGRPGGSVSGLVARNRAPGVHTLGFTLAWRDAAPSVGAAELLARLRSVLAPRLLDELARPDSALQPSPRVRGPEVFAGTAVLDPGGCGTVFPYLHVYATTTRVVGVLQTIPMEKKRP